MIRVGIEAIGLAAPGLADWPQTRRVLTGETPYEPAELPPYQPQLLPPNERRRATPAVRQAFRAAEQATAGRDVRALATVFAGSDADMAILHRICGAVAGAQKLVSPTDFHNSVHNAAAGYWGIAAGATAPSTTLAGYDGSFALGLFEAALQSAIEEQASLLVAFDVPAPAPLLQARPLGCAASCALWLQPSEQPAAFGHVLLSLCDEPETMLADVALEAQRRANPALRVLPLLRLIALGVAGRVVLPNAGARSLCVQFTP